MSVAVVGSFTLGQINVAAAGAITTIAPLLAQFDLMLTGSFGLGAVLGDLSAQLAAALQAQLVLSLSIINPFDSLLAQLRALLQVYASLQAALSLPNLSFALGANIGVAANLSIRLPGIQALIAASLAIKIPVVSFFANLAASLSVGPVVLLTAGFTGPDTLAGAGVQLQSLFSAGVGGISPFDSVQGVFLVTKSPSAGAAMSAILLTS